MFLSDEKLMQLLIIAHRVFDMQVVLELEGELSKRCYECKKAKKLFRKMRCKQRSKQRRKQR